jgi:hypothetical protein
MVDIAKKNTEVYETVGLDELVTYAIQLLTSEKKPVTYENIVAKAFTLFPKKFSLLGYPQWPDSAVVNKSWWRCRTDKGYITGSVKDGFRLTSLGERVAEKVASQLGPGHSIVIQTKVNRADIRTREGKLLLQVEETVAFKAFRSTGSVENIDLFALKDAILLPPDAPKDSIRRNLHQLNQAAAVHQRSDILKFLEFVADRLLKAAR